MLNINKGHNLGLERKSKTLSDYATFVAKVREYEKKHPLEKAVKLTVKYCIKNNILEDYFKQNSPEVVSMNFTKYNEKDAIKELRKEAREKGMEEGIIMGMKKGIIEGRTKGIERGKKEGQNYVLKLMAQGLSHEEIKKKIEKMSHKKK